jgi:hypothetical protein
MQLSINDKVEWFSAAGHLTGLVKNVVLDNNARYETVPWIDVEVVTKSGHSNMIRLCATHSNLLMMQVSKL